MTRFLKIQVENKNYLEIELNGQLESIMVYKYNDKGEMLQGRRIDASEFVDLYNILVYAQENGKKICDLWGCK